MNIDSEQKADISFHLNYLKNLDINGYTLESINFLTNEIIFCKKNEENKIKYNFDEMEKQKNMVGESTINNETTSDVNKILPNSEMLSETSDQNQVFSYKIEKEPQQQSQSQNQNKNQNGGNGLNNTNNKSIFKSSKYSDTSSVKFTEISNYSKTSSAMYNDRSDNFSETSVIGQIGGGIETSDTLMSISELKERKNKSKSSSSSTTFKSNLDIGIFKKSQNQSGGSKSNLDLKKRMGELGINSSSTSSICE